MNGKPKVEGEGLGVLMFKLPIAGCIAFSGVSDQIIIALCHLL